MGLLDAIGDALSQVKYGPDYKARGAFLARLGELQQAKEQSAIEQAKAETAGTQARTAGELARTAQMPQEMAFKQNQDVRSQKLLELQQQDRALAEREGVARIAAQNASTTTEKVRASVEAEQLRTARMHNAAMAQALQEANGGGGAGGVDTVGMVRSGRLTPEEAIASTSGSGDPMIDKIAAGTMRRNLVAGDVANPERNASINGLKSHIMQLQDLYQRVDKDPSSVGVMSRLRVGIGAPIASLGGPAAALGPSPADVATQQDVGQGLIGAAAQLAKGRVSPRLMKALQDSSTLPNANDDAATIKSKIAHRIDILRSTAQQEMGVTPEELDTSGGGQAPAMGGLNAGPPRPGMVMGGVAPGRPFNPHDFMADPANGAR